MRLAGWVFGILFLIVSSVAIVFIGRNAWSFLSTFVAGARTLEPSTYVPLTVTLVTATLGLAAALYTQNRVRKREIEAAHRDRKIEIYLEFLQTFESIILSSKPELGPRKIDENEAARRMLEVRTKAVLWGSTGVLRALGDLQHIGAKRTPNIVDVMDNLQREMRKDIGLSNIGLEKDFFVKLIFNNPDEIEELKEQTKHRAQQI